MAAAVVPIRTSNRTVCPPVRDNNFIFYDVHSTSQLTKSDSESAQQVHSQQVPSNGNGTVSEHQMDKKTSLEWSPEKHKFLDINTEYTLNQSKIIDKKIKACDREPISANHTVANSVIKFSATSFETMKKLISSLYGNRENTMTEITTKMDENSVIEQDIVKIFYKTKQNRKGRLLLVFNMYRTTSTMLVNGPSLKKFQNEEFPMLEEAIYPELQW